jgi:phage FluMu gp28-like protein
LTPPLGKFLDEVRRGRQEWQARRNRVLLLGDAISPGMSDRLRQMARPSATVEAEPAAEKENEDHND